MKKVLALVMVVALFLVTSTIALADGMSLKSIDTIMSEIRLEQGVQSNDKINPDKVSPSKLEELGDSVMEAMIGNSDIHDQMDINLGGDGSASLTAMHSRIGYNYLVGYPNGMMTLMSAGMMGSSGLGNSPVKQISMMGNTGNYSYGGMMGGIGWGSIVIGIIVLILFIAILLLVVKVLHKQQVVTNSETAKDILEKRYAKGDLTQEQYLTMVDHLKK